MNNLEGKSLVDKTEKNCQNACDWPNCTLPDCANGVVESPDRTFPEVIEDYHAKRRLVDKQETEPTDFKNVIAFAKWYSGMGEEKVISAFRRWRKEEPNAFEISEPKKESEACKILELAIKADAFDKNLGYDFFGRLNEWRRKTGF